jgi:Protein of unknown function (DUF3352)
VKPRFVPILLAALALIASLAFAGCGGGGSSSADPATLAPADSQVFVEAQKPEGEAATEVTALAKRIAGVEDIGGLIVSKLEESAEEGGHKVDFAREIEPWLGERAGIFLGSSDGDDFTEIGLALATTDPEAASEFLAKRLALHDEPPEQGSYEGIDYEAAPDSGRVYGLIGNFLAAAEDVPTFKAMVDASKGESLADRNSYTKAIAETSDDAVARVYADIGSLVKAGGDPPDAETKDGLKILGIDWQNSTAVAGLVPGSDTVEIDLSTDVLSEPPPSGDASALLGALPGDSTAALAFPQTGKAFAQLLDRIDREGIPSKGVQPHEFKGALAATGIDLDAITEAVGDSAVFLDGQSKAELAGAVVLEAKSPTEAKNTVSSLGLYLRVARTPGVTALSGKLSGFSLRGTSLGPKPLVIAATGKRITIAYGLPAATRALAEGGQTLADNPHYKEAVASLGGTPISGFADGGAALRLAETLLSPDQMEGFLKAKPYLSKIEYLGLGSVSTDEVGRAKLIVGVGR